MARKIPTSGQISMGWKKRLATDIELKDLLFSLVGLALFIFLPIVVWMWMCEGVLAAASVFFVLLMPLLAAWWVMRRVRRREKRP